MMPEERRYHLAGPILLILIGFALLLTQLGIWDIPWVQLWRWWPLALVIAGLDLMLSRSRLGQIALLAIVAMVVLAVVILIPRAEPLRTERIVSESFSHPLGDAVSARVRLKMGIGRLEVASLHSSDTLIEADVRYDSRRTRFHTSAEQLGEGVEVSLEGEQQGMGGIPGDSGDSWDVRLNENVPLRLDIDGGVSRAQLDLTELALTRLDLSIGVGDVTLALPGRTQYRARIDGGVGMLEIETPEGVPVRIKVDGGLGALDVSGRFRRDGNYYVSDEYRTGAEAIEIDIDAGVGALKIR